MLNNDNIIEINNVPCVVTPEKQEFTTAEMGIPGIKLFGHFTSNKAHKALGLHRHSGCVEISYYVTGNQTYQTLDSEYLLTGNMIFIAKPGEPHGVMTDYEGKVEVYWIQIDMSFFDDFLALQPPFSIALRNFLINENKHLVKCKKNLKPLLDKALKDLPGNNIYTKFSGLTALYSFLSEMISINSLNNSGISDQINRALNYIGDNIEKSISLEEIAEHTGLSLSHFKKRFKFEIGDTPNNYINSLKIEKAKEMLSSGQYTITDVAYALDFSSSAYFSVVFKHHMNVTPKDFLKR